MVLTEVTTSGDAQRSRPDEFPDLDDAGLAARLRQSVSTLRAWRSRQPDRLPPGVRVGRIWLYDKKVVEEWLAARRAMAPCSAVKMPAARAESSYKRRGKPSKKEAAAAQAMGLTVPAWRARQAGGDAKNLDLLQKPTPTVTEGL